MMSEVYKEHKLQSLFTFRIVEIIKNIRIHPIPKIGGLSLGLSAAVGIILTILSLGNYLPLKEPIDISIAPSFLSESRVLESGEITVNILRVSDTSFLASKQEDKSLNKQKAFFLAPQAETGQWTKKSDMPTPRGALKSCVVNNKIYVIGGASGANIVGAVEEYDPASDKWAKKADMLTPRTHLSVSEVNGKIYVKLSKFKKLLKYSVPQAACLLCIYKLAACGTKSSQYFFKLAKNYSFALF